MKKIFAAILSVLMLVSLTACGGSPSSAAPSAPASSTAPSSTAPSSEATPTVTTGTPGKLTIGTSADFAPYEFHIMEDGVDKIVGFDMALAQTIADEMGLTLEIKDIAFDSILMELNAGTIDLGIAGFSPTPERLQAVDMSDIYYTSGQSIMVKKEDLGKYSSYTDFNSSEFSVGAQTGSIQEGLAKEHTPNANYVGLQAVPNIIMELKSGKINAAFIETAVADGYIKTQDDIAILCEVPFDSEGSAIAIKKGNTEMVTAVNEIIAKVIADGSMSKMVEEANALAEKAIS